MFLLGGGDDKTLSGADKAINELEEDKEALQNAITKIKVKCDTLKLRTEELEKLSTVAEDKLATNLVLLSARARSHEADCKVAVKAAEELNKLASISQELLELGPGSKVETPNGDTTSIPAVPKTENPVSAPPKNEVPQSAASAVGVAKKSGSVVVVRTSSDRVVRDGQGSSPRPVVICGPSGVGKGTLIDRLMAEFPEKVGFSTSHTTRAPRPGEIDGQHYHFSTVEKMQTEINQGKFLEHAQVHTNLYGTSLAAVEAVARAGKTCILDIDIQGAKSVKRSPLDALFVFIKPPSLQELERRLRGRGTEKEEAVAKRLSNAVGEIAQADEPGLFHHVLVNNDLESTYLELKRALGFQRRESVVVVGREAQDSGACIRPVVVCGPSGVGKGTLIDRLMSDYPQKVGFSTSHTTRAPRPGEVDGQHYHFSTVEIMREQIQQGKFIEHAEVHGNYYGTSVAAVQEVIKKSKLCVLDIDTQGARLVKQSSLDAVFVFIRPPSMELLEKRLRGRGTEKEESIQKRLKNAVKEISESEEPGFFDFVLVNDDLDTTYQHFKDLVLPRSQQSRVVVVRN